MHAGIELVPLCRLGTWLSWTTLWPSWPKLFVGMGPVRNAKHMLTFIGLLVLAQQRLVLASATNNPECAKYLHNCL